RVGDEVQQLFQFGFEFQFLAGKGRAGHRESPSSEIRCSALIIGQRASRPEGRFDALAKRQYDRVPISETDPMTAPTTALGLWIPFANPVEIFSVAAENTINYTDSYKAVCHQLTANGLSVLQCEATAPARLVIGVQCEGRIFFLPGSRVDFRPVGAALFAMQARFP